MAKTACGISSIPLDIFEFIFHNLELVDIKSARLASKLFSHIGPHFKSFCAQQTTDLSVESLRSQNDLASHPQLRSAVKKLVVNAVVYDTSELDRTIKKRTGRVVEYNGPFTTTRESGLSNDELFQAKSNLKWMYTQQSKQKLQPTPRIIDSLATILCLYGTLDTIDCDAYVVQSPDGRVSTAETGEWRLVFVQASAVYKITMAAIVMSGLALNTLSIFRETPRCSVTSFDVNSCMAQLGALPESTSAFSLIENLAISFSTRVETDLSKIELARNALEAASTSLSMKSECSDQDNDDESNGDSDGDEDTDGEQVETGVCAGRLSPKDPGVLAEGNFPGIASMLRQTPKLIALDLHMFNTLRGPTNKYKRVFEHIANTVKLPVLTQLSLRGLPSTAESLLAFLENHPKIADLHIEEMDLKAGSWRLVIKRICQLPGLKQLYLSNLCDEQGLFNLIFKGDDGTQAYVTRETSFSFGGGIKVHTRAFKPAEIELISSGMEFELITRGRARGSPELMRWEQIRHLKYSL